MTILKILFLLLIIIPFALFLLYILDRLMDEMPSKAEQEAAMSPVERRRSRAASQGRRERTERTVNHRQNPHTAAEKRRRRKARKTERKQHRKSDRL